MGEGILIHGEFSEDMYLCMYLCMYVCIVLPYLLARMQTPETSECPPRQIQRQRRFSCQRKRLKNDTKTVHKRRFSETPLSFFETSRRLANEITAGIAV